jgi:hypothetical protein
LTMNRIATPNSLSIGSSLILMIMPFVFTSCLHISNSPETSARKWTEALFTNDKHTLKELTCDQEFTNTQIASLVFEMLSGLDIVFDGLKPAFDLSNLKFKTIYQEGDVAIVQVSGSIEMSALFISNSKYLEEKWNFIKEDGLWKFCAH